jgi:ubiquinone/menaquinone biosynthesis C-methylase UbiE
LTCGGFDVIFSKGHHSMKQGDFTDLAKDYVNRPGYSLSVLRAILAYAGLKPSACVVADVGAGTGKLAENLISLGLSGEAVEPNDAMRAEGRGRLGDCPFVWRAGQAEELPLADSSVDWILMGSAFHWTCKQQALAEFYRVLKPAGYFTAMWNPRDLERSELNYRIDAKIRELVPDLNRVSSGADKYTKNLEDELMANGQFGDLVFVEAPHAEIFTVDRYLGVWRSVNDIQAQAGERFVQIMEMIAKEIAGLEKIVIPYRTRAWTVRSLKSV